MLKIRRPLGRLIFNMGIAIPGKTVFLIETAPSITEVLIPQILVPFIFGTMMAKSECAIFMELLPYGLTHGGWMMHICISKLNIIGSDNGLSPGRCQAIIWTSDRILLIWPLETNFSKMLIKIHTFSFKKMHVKMLSAKWKPFCLILNVLKVCGIISSHSDMHVSHHCVVP